MSEKPAPAAQLFKDIPGLVQAMTGENSPVVPPSFLQMPPAPPETERPRFDWNVALKDARKMFKVRNARDVLTLGARIGTDFVPEIGEILAISNLAMAGVMEGVQIHRKGWGGWFKDTALCKIFNKDVTTLTGKEKALAVAYGTAWAGINFFASSFVKRLIRVPGVSGIASLMTTRTLLQVIGPRLGTKLYEIGTKNKKEEKAAEEWVDLALSCTSIAMTTIMSLGMFEEGLKHYQEAHPHITEPQILPTSTETAAATAVAGVAKAATAEFTKTPTPTVIPSSTLMPEATPTAPVLNWHPGQEPTSQQLQQLTDSAGGLDKVDHLDNVPVHNQAQTIYRFNLDNDPEPDVWAVYNNQTHQFQPFVWEDKGHLYRADLDLDGQIDPGNLLPQWLKDNHLWPSGQGGGGERAPLPEGGQVNCDLNNDGQNDLGINDDGKWFINRDNDPNLTYDSAKDLLLTDQPVFSQTDGKAIALEAADGQMWWRGSDGKMTGLVKHNEAIVYYLDREANPLQPDFNDNILVNPLANAKFSLEAVQGETDRYQLSIKNAEINFGADDRWEYDSNGLGKGYLADGRTLAFDPSGSKGIMAWQYQLALAHPDWTPDEVAKEAFRHQSEPININIPRPEPYRAPGGTLTFEQLAMGPRGGDEGVIMHDVHEVNGNLNATQVAQAAHIAVVNNNLTGPAMIGDVNNTIARFNLESTFGQIMKENGIRDEWVSNYARQAAFTAIRDNSIGWQIPSDKIISGQINQESLKSFTNYTDWEEWLRDHGYIN